MVIFDPAFSKERKNHILYQALQTLAKGVVKDLPGKKKPRAAQPGFQRPCPMLSGPQWGIKKPRVSKPRIYQVACKCPEKKSEQQAKMANIASSVMILCGIIVRRAPAQRGDGATYLVDQQEGDR